REGVVKRVVGKLGGEGLLFGNIAFGEDEVEDLSVGVASRRTRYLGRDDPTVLALVTLRVTHLVGLSGLDAPEVLFGDADVVMVGEERRVITENLLPGITDHLAEGVVDRDDTLPEISKGH